ncbi:hypothetical protein PMAYCL1PPCAC_13982, partial [Pristionchus mayeri]
LSSVEEWRRKILEFSRASDDVLIPVTSRVFDALSLILKGSELPRVRNALASIGFERSNCVQFENAEKPSVRSLFFGIIQSLHLTLKYLKEETMADSDTVRSTISEWSKRSSNFPEKLTEPLVSLFSRANETMLSIVTNIELRHILRSFGSLDSELSNYLKFENTDELSIRSLMYGVIQCVHLTLLHLIEKKNKTNSSEEVSVPEERSTEELHTSTQLLLSKTIEDEMGLSRLKTGIDEGNDSTLYDVDRLSMV